MRHEDMAVLQRVIFVLSPAHPHDRSNRESVVLTGQWIFPREIGINISVTILVEETVIVGICFKRIVANTDTELLSCLLDISRNDLNIGSIHLTLQYGSVGPAMSIRG